MVFPKEAQCKASLTSCFIPSKVRPASTELGNQRKESFEMLRNLDFSRQVLRTIEDVVFELKSSKTVAGFLQHLFKV